MQTFTTTNVKVLNELLPESMINNVKFSLIACSNRRTALFYSNKYRVTSTDISTMSLVLDRFHINFLNENSINYTVSDNAPETFKELRKLNPHELVISNIGCDKTIYDSATANQRFRAVHDYCHLSTNSNFSEAGEKVAIKKQFGSLVKYLSNYDYSPLEHMKICKLFLIDSALQVREYYATKKFVEDQKAFALWHMNNTPYQEIIQYLED